MYMAPNLPQFGNPKEFNEADMFNNFRVYGTLFVIVEFLICVVGIKLIQIVGPLSLACVVFAILSIFAGRIAAREGYSEKLVRNRFHFLKNWPAGGRGPGGGGGAGGGGAAGGGGGVE